MQQPGSRPCVHSTKLCELEQSHLGLFSECSLQALPAHPVRTKTPPKGDGCFPSALHTEGVLGPYQELLSSGPTGPSVESTEPSPRSLVFSEVRPPRVGGAVLRQCGVSCVSRAGNRYQGKSTSARVRAPCMWQPPCLPHQTPNNTVAIYTFKFYRHL